ncbi:MAG: hypothetical protein AB1597_06510 [Chloroflexota bacterium]
MVEEGEEPGTKAERRAKKKARRKFPVHGGSLRAVYPQVVRKHAKSPKR